jgi:hypothetical protein
MPTATLVPKSPRARRSTGRGGPQPFETMPRVARPIQPPPYPPAPAGEGWDGLRPEPTPRLSREPMPVEPEPGVRLAPPTNNTANRRGSAMVEDESDVEIRNRVPLPAGFVDDYRFPQVRAQAPLGNTRRTIGVAVIRGECPIQACGRSTSPGSIMPDAFAICLPKHSKLLTNSIV